MNMKDAFRFQNKLKGLMWLRPLPSFRTGAISSRSRPHIFGARSCPILRMPWWRKLLPASMLYHANEVAAFLMSLLEEREKLCRAIHAAKNALDLDMDSEVG